MTVFTSDTVGVAGNEASSTEEVVTLGVNVEEAAGDAVEAREAEAAEETDADPVLTAEAEDDFDDPLDADTRPLSVYGAVDAVIAPVPVPHPPAAVGV